MFSLKGITKVLLGAACAAALATAARAADAVIEEAVIVEPGFSWTGLYIGVNAGYSWGDFDHGFDVAAFPPFFDGISEVLETSADGATGGAQIGYNWQVNSLVFGVEADIQAADLDGSDSSTFEFFPPSPVPIAVGLDTEVETELDWFGTARLRLGYVPTERLMVYGTGGFAFGETTTSASAAISVQDVPIAGDEISETTSRTGWAAGAGAEYALTNNWTVKTEYLYTDLGTEDVLAEELLTLDSEVKFHTVRVGLNYKF